MMAAPSAAPVLSTPDTHIFEDPGPQIDVASQPRTTDEQLYVTYEIERTVNEIRAGSWKRVALQFPDHMLVDAPRVFQALSRGLKQARRNKPTTNGHKSVPRTAMQESEDLPHSVKELQISGEDLDMEEKLYILADTSYGACCVDEVAAEHADADVVVHYGRACLSPTARLPVIYCFTKAHVEVSSMLEAFKETYPDREQKVILMADIPYVTYVPVLTELLQNEGYLNIFATEVIHDTLSLLPNRTVPMDVKADSQALQNYQIFHISDPPPSLLLTLSSRVGAIYIYPTSGYETGFQKPILASSTMALRRRYALLTSLSTAPIFGILINTLSVKNYQEILQHVKKQISDAGKKSYTFVVGKVNAAKVANFSEVGGWVVIGCWESSLFESKDFWKPVITPFELGLALQGDTERVWTGEWTSNYQAILNSPPKDPNHHTNGKGEDDMSNDLYDSEEESEPPEFDLRTGRYVSHSRPMRTNQSRQVKGTHAAGQGQSLVQKPKGDVAVIGNEVSPAAEFFKSQRSWRGLGSDFEIKYDESETADDSSKGAAVEEGRSGIARGYTVGDAAARH